MKNILAASLFLFASFLPSTAQKEEGVEKKAPAGRLAWFVATSFPEGIENPLDVMTGKDIKQIMLSKRMASEAVKIPADGIIRVVRKIEKPQDPSKPPYEILAEARISETTNEALIILVPTAQKEGALPLFKTKVQDLANFKGGDCMFMNLTNLKIAVQLGEKKTGVKPGEVMIHEAGVLDKAVNMPIGYYVFNPNEEEWKLLSSSIAVMQPTRREICVFSWDSKYERVDYHGITFPVTQRAAEN